MSTTPNEFWTDDFITAEAWLRSNYGDKCIKVGKSVRANKKTPGLFDSW